MAIDLTKICKTIAAGGFYQCSFSATVSGNAGASETDTATASGTDDDGNPVSGSDDATVTITDVPSSILVTKSANPTSLPAPGGSVNFTVRVDNTSAVDTVTISSLIDSVYGNLNGQGTCSVPQTIAAGGFYQCSFSATVSGAGGTTHTDVATDLNAANTGSVTNKATATNGTVTSNEATATVNQVASTGQIAPTATTCQNFRDGTAGNLTEVLYTVKGTKINSVAPGVLFYYSLVTVPAGTHTINVAQTTSPNFTLFGIQQDQAILWSSNCTKVQSNATGSFTVTNNQPTTYIIGIKYDPAPVVGKTKPGGNGQVTYTFTTKIDGVAVSTSPDSLVLKQKPK